jgi:hypothetical protein
MAKTKDKATAEEGKVGRRRCKGKAFSSKEGFYAEALSEAERVLLPEAREIEGLDEEIALLRVKLTSALAEQPDNMPLMMRGVELLVKAVAAKYRLSKKSQDNLAEAIDGVLKEIGAALFSN